jgi:hypothetical protein
MSWWDNLVAMYQNKNSNVVTTNNLQAPMANAAPYVPPVSMTGYQMPGVPGAANTGATTPFEPSWSDRAFGWTDKTNGMQHAGMVGPLAQAFSTGMNAYLGLKNLDLAKDTLAFQKDSFSKQFENQRTLTNAQLADRQRARLSANPNGYQSVDAYMKANGV